MLDTLLSKLDHPCVLEMLVAPVDQALDLKSQYECITRLLSINQYGDDTTIDITDIDPFDKQVTEQQTVLPVERKRDPMADDIAREHQELYRTLRQPQLLFHVKAFAMNQENALMLASAVAESGFGAGKYQLLPYSNTDRGKSKSLLDDSLKGSHNMTVSLQAMSPAIWDEDCTREYRDMARLCRMATVDELKGLVRLPVGGHGSPRCIRKSTDPKPGEQDEKSILIGDDLESGRPDKRCYPEVLSEMFSGNSPANLEARLSFNKLTKHMFVAGVPGSGKTTAIYNLLVQLYREKIPFLVIEPAKTEYRILKTLQSHSDPMIKELTRKLRIYSPGNDNVSPFRFNPLYFPKGITLDEHIGQVLACFDAAMPMGGPLQALIAEAVEEVYKGYDEKHFPRMTDLLASAQRTMKDKEYEGEVKSNLQAAIEVRLGLLTRRAMGRIFHCQASVPSVEELLANPTIIEMDYLSQDHACLLTLFLLSSIREYLKIDPTRLAKGLHHVTVIEEAHNIVGRTGRALASEEIADPKAFAAQYVSRMLAELRALGEGIIIADQLPSAVAPEVVKNTGTKLAHRLVSNDDREDLGGAMLLDAMEMEEIARLDVGEAYFYTEGLHRPRRVRCLDAHEYLNLGDYPDSSSLVSYIADEDWFFPKRQHYRTIELSREVSQTLKQARDLITAEEGTSWDLSSKCGRLSQVGQVEGKEAFTTQYRQLRDQVISHRTTVENALREAEKYFSMIAGIDHVYSVKFARSIEDQVRDWQQTVKPDFLKLQQQYCTIQSQIPEPDNPK